VQIFSNQTYSWKQIQDDKELQTAGKMLYRQEPFQMYHRCAGSLIDTNIVLTAAHCVAKGPFTENGKVLQTREIRIGTQDLRQAGTIYRIEAVVVHAGYRTTGQKDDIALLRIAPKRRAIAQKPIRLPDAVPNMRRVTTNSPIEVLGWGYTEVVARGERHELPGNVAQFTQDKLQIAEMEAMDQAKCKRIRGYGDIDRKICATTPSDRTEPGNAFSCRNDSGGPVIQRLNRAGQVVQVGIVSGGVGCGDEENGVQNPSLFVDLQLFTKWIAAAKKKLATVQNDVVTQAEP
jgi:secreted trypsin-like serine protease